MPHPKCLITFFCCCSLQVFCDGPVGGTISGRDPWLAVCLRLRAPRDFLQVFGTARWGEQFPVGILGSLSVSVSVLQGISCRFFSASLRGPGFGRGHAFRSPFCARCLSSWYDGFQVFFGVAAWSRFWAWSRFPVAILRSVSGFVVRWISGFFRRRCVVPVSGRGHGFRSPFCARCLASWYDGFQCFCVGSPSWRDDLQVFFGVAAWSRFPVAILSLDSCFARCLSPWYDEFQGLIRGVTTCRN
ncbi:uncharacterized protein LOC144819906 isoform X2 [Lissotriton helveticus]